MKLSHDPDPGPSLPLQVKTIDGKAVSFGIFSAEMQMILQDHRRHIWFECIVHTTLPPFSLSNFFICMNSSCFSFLCIYKV